jgi:hypothetical protein
MSDIQEPFLVKKRFTGVPLGQLPFEQTKDLPTPVSRFEAVRLRFLTGRMGSKWKNDPYTYKNTDRLIFEIVQV